MSNDTTPEFVAPEGEDLENIPDPNGNPAMVGDVLPDEWTADGNS